MRLEESRTAYQELSGKASELARTLAFSGIAIIWVFRSTGDGPPTIPDTLVLPGAFLVTSLAFDLLQYVTGAAFWGGLSRSQELKGIGADQDFKAPRWINWPMLGCFWAKLVFIGLAYASLARFLYSRVAVAS